MGGCAGKSKGSAKKTAKAYTHRNVGGRPSGVNTNAFGKPKVSLRFGKSK